MTSNKSITPGMNLVKHLLEWQARRAPNKVAVVHRGRENTYASLNAQANQVSHWLHQNGVKSGDRVVLYGVNGDRLIAALFGVLKAGAAFVPVHPETPSSKLGFILQDCAPAAVVSDHDLVSRFECLVEFPGAILLTSGDLPIKKTRGKAIAPWEATNTYPNQLIDVEAKPDDLAAIIYTSGSTKEPRGVMSPRRQVIFATSAINAVLGNSAEDVILCGLPLSFDYGLYQVFLAFQVGAKLILERDFGLPIAIPRILKEYNVTGFPGAPSLFAMLLRSRFLERVELPDLRYITSTGDVFPPSHILRLRELLPHTTVFPMYGLTECKRVSIMPQGYSNNYKSSVGLPLPGTQVSIVDETGQEVSPGVVGELVVRGPHIMAGYWNAPEETAQRFRQDDSTGEVLLYTGDYFREDGDGFLYFVGRGETFIKSRGEKVSPAEIESFLCTLKGVAEAAAVGIPDPVLGESICVFVSTTRPGVVDSASIAEQCRAVLPPSTRPRRVIILESFLPKTANGKTDRARIRLIAMEKTDADVADSVVDDRACFE